MRIWAVTTLATLFLVGCPPEKQETPTKGSLHVLIPESAAPVLIREVDAFLTLYRKNGAEISYSIVSTDESIQRFILDTLRAVFTTRPLTEPEQRAIRSQSGDLVEILLAYDAVVAVVHFRNPLEKITTQEIKGILEGTIHRWEELSHRGGLKGAIHLVLQDSSDISAYLERRILGGKKIERISQKRPSSSLLTLQAVVEDPQAVGFVGIDWIDSARVPAKVLEIAELDAPADTTFRLPPESIGKFYSPHPAHVYRSYYPLKRALYYCTRSRLGDLAAGFGSFVANKEGQKIFLQRGLVPGTQPIRLKPTE